MQEEGITTVSGWVTHDWVGFPRWVMSWPLGAFTLRVEEMEGMRVAKLKLIRVQERLKRQVFTGK